MVNLDPGSGKAIETLAQQHNVVTIDYDRLTAGGSASYYVSYDNVKVGEDQGTALTQCPQVKGKSAVNYVEIDGAPTDNNATLFAQGYNSVLSKQPGWNEARRPDRQLGRRDRADRVHHDARPAPRTSTRSWSPTTPWRSR